LADQPRSSRWDRWTLTIWLALRNITFSLPLKN
jgi:hypothetical protein